MNDLVITEEFGGFYAYSPSFPGLSVWAQTRVQLDERVAQAIAVLARLNAGA